MAIMKLLTCILLFTLSAFADDQANLKRYKIWYTVPSDHRPVVNVLATPKEQIRVVVEATDEQHAREQFHRTLPKATLQSISELAPEHVAPGEKAHRG